MSRYICILLYSLALIHIIVTAPVDPKKKSSETEKKKKAGEESEEVDDFGLEYGRYLQQVVSTLEEDKDFAKKLENISSEQIKTGNIAHELEFVKHNVRTKLDELKRIEIERIRKYVQEQVDRTELGLYRDEDGRILPSPDGRRWRTISGHPGLDRKGVKLPQHLDIANPHSFEIDDLKKLIHSATKDLEALDKQRREDFKKYELEKEAKYRESLKNMTDDQRKEEEKHHDELIKKHKDHPKVHHPGSKDQLEQVWEEEDHMPKEEFDPKTFFAMHDINGDGHLDVNEVEAILRPEVRKMYNNENVEDDPVEMEEEYHRMREHVFNETDRDRDGLISMAEFMRMTEEQSFQKDEGWKGLDEQDVYSEAELEEYMRQRQLAMNQQYYGDPRAYYNVEHGQPGVPPQHINYQGVPPQQQYHQPVYPPQGHPDQQHYQGVPPQHYQGVPPNQQYQGVPQHQQQYQGVPQHQQQYQGVPQHQQQYQGVPQHQQQYQGVPQHQQQYQGVPPQQQHQGVPPQQQHQGVPPQQQHLGVPPQQQQHVGVPAQQQQHVGVPPQQKQIHQPPSPQHQQLQGGNIQQPVQPNLQNPNPSSNVNQISSEKLEVPNANIIPQQPPK